MYASHELPCIRNPLQVQFLKSITCNKFCGCRCKALVDAACSYRITKIGELVHTDLSG